MTMITNTIVALILVALLVGGIFVGVYSSDGSLGVKIKNALNDIIKKNTLEQEELINEELGVKIDSQKSIDSLKGTIETMRDNVKKKGVNYCFGRYERFKSLEGVSISIGRDNSVSRTNFKVFSGAGAKQLVRDASFSIDGIVPCVIAGDEGVVSSFSKSFLNDEKVKNVQGGHFRPVNQIILSYDSGPATYDGNIIRVPSLGSVVNDEDDNFDDYGIIYTPDGVHMCFFPTQYGNEVCTGVLGADENNPDGLDNDCLGADIKENTNIFRQLNY